MSGSVRLLIVWLQRIEDLMERLQEEQSKRWAELYSGKVDLGIRLVFLVAGLSSALVGWTSRIPLKLLWFDFPSPVLFYVGAGMTLVAAVTARRTLFGVAGMFMVFLSLNRAIGFYELIVGGSSNLWGSLSQQVVIGALMLRITLEAVVRADR